jgi:hypothetical protein
MNAIDGRTRTVISPVCNKKNTPPITDTLYSLSMRYGIFKPFFMTVIEKPGKEDNLKYNIKCGVLCMLPDIPTLFWNHLSCVFANNSMKGVSCFSLSACLDRIG